VVLVLLIRAQEVLGKPRHRDDLVEKLSLLLNLYTLADFVSLQTNGYGNC
jgi:hypothetical protein